jgi:arylsulfatase A-like enzyme
MPSFSRRDFLKLLGLSPFLLAPEVASLPTRPIGSSPSQRAQPIPPNILILVFDTLTARNMSLYGYPRQNTPNFERFAQQALVYHHHYAAANFTSPGTASLLTGAYPWKHRAIHMHAQVVEPYPSQNLFSLLPEHYRFSYTHNPLVYILFRQMRENIDQLKLITDLCLISDSPASSRFDRDYTTAYLSELLMFRNGYYPSGSMFLSHLDRIWRFFRQDNLNRAHQQEFPRGLPNHFDEWLPSFLVFTLEQVVDWLDSQVQSAKQPFFGYIHVLPPHPPYVTRREFLDRFVDDWKPPSKPLHHFQEGHSDEDLNMERRYYDEDIAYVDAEFGRLYDILERSGTLENTLLIITSDHGEMFERGIFSHITATLYEPILHIPLIISGPGISKRQDIYTPTSAVDLLPTLLQVCGQPIPPGCDGEVLPGFATAQPSTGRSIYALEAKISPKNDPTRACTIALYKDRYKLIYYRGYEDFSEVYELYDLQNDPEELADLYSSTDPLAAALKEEMGKDIGITFPQ